MNAQQPMSEKDQYGACMTQVELLERRIHNRQAYQWKITLGLWALTGAATSFLWGKCFYVPYQFAVAAWIAHTFLWVRSVAIRNHDDQEIRNYFSDEARSILITGARRGDPLPTIHHQNWRVWNRRWWLDRRNWLWWHDWGHRYESLATLFLLLLACWLINHSSH